MEHTSGKHDLGPVYFVSYLANGSFALYLIGIERLIA